ncbi:hypothetical protein PA7_31830 [Pseudonocardia asaccharolytica DSM 44247 = NBRC 16224]|uniref:Uncharacterized protein n=1 Tax=Pseudonocardia asaccharolytica DSM 44247 = NBRC 16224 TaxID=1123024 RepID=A0A511D3H9_9PSEU|nr:hypothetical protein PA7_31830 [Pseudonocardia asaccharolytica DSM 44247 = NBRC 16224]
MIVSSWRSHAHRTPSPTFLHNPTTAPSYPATPPIPDIVPTAPARHQRTSHTPLVPPGPPQTHTSPGGPHAHPPAAPLLDALGVTIHLDDGQQRAEAIVIGKVVDLAADDTRHESLVIGEPSSTS